MSDFVVAKYGGTSMAQPEVVAEIVAQQSEQKLIVVSAPGKLQDSDEKLTDELESYASSIGESFEAEQAAAEAIIDRFDRAYSALGNKALGKLRDDLYNQLSPDFGKNDSFYASIGEYGSTKYFAELTGGKFMKPSHIKFGFSGSLNQVATIDSISQDLNLRPGKGSRPIIIPGFYGYTPDNKRELLGRGGSDRSGALYAKGLDWDYENWTDQDGIYSADPRQVPNAKLIKELSRNEVREGAHGGSKILQGDTIVDLAGSSVATTIKNTFNPSAPGTLVSPQRTANPSESPVVAVSGRNLSTVSIYDIGMANALGYLAPIYEVAGKLGISIEHSPTDQDSATFTFSEKVKIQALVNFRDFIRQNTISPDAKVEITRDRGVVYVVGEALKDEDIKTAAIGRIGLRLASDSLGFKDMVSHEDSPSIALLTSAEKVDGTMRSLHNEFIED